MPQTRFFDTETCGLHGPIVLFQYQDDDGPIHVIDTWKIPIRDVLQLLEETCNYRVIGFNLAFDWFHVCQFYTTIKTMISTYPIDVDKSLDKYLLQYALSEDKARDYNICLKPVDAIDLLLKAKKGPYQALMERKPIRIRAVHKDMVKAVVETLTKEITFDPIYFAKKRKGYDWSVTVTKDQPDFRDLKLEFAASMKLKDLIVHIFKKRINPVTNKYYFDGEITYYSDIAPYKVNELGYAPVATLLAKMRDDATIDWNGTWPSVIELHINHWIENKKARQYAYNDVVYTKMLFEHLQEKNKAPLVSDANDILACMVGAVRWRGYTVDIEKIKLLRQEVVDKIKAVEQKVNVNSSAEVRKYLSTAMSPVERAVIKASTKKEILNEIVNWNESTVCQECKGSGCSQCQEGLVPTDKKHKAAILAQEVLDARHGEKEIELYDKLLLAGCFHASFNVVGALSGRMSGSDGFNAQAIKNDPRVRRCFTFCKNNEHLIGGDYAALEVCLMEAVYNDPLLKADLLSGKKFHGLFGEALFHPKTYEEIVQTKELYGILNLYDRSKRGVFGIAYGGNENTLMRKCNISKENAVEGFRRFTNRYKEWGKKRQEVVNMFCSMRQEGGLGTKVIWKEPADYIESMFGFRRYFVLENYVCKKLFLIAQTPPKEWYEISNEHPKVKRKGDREQTLIGSTMSALYGTAFGIQSNAMRAAANHVIQSSGSHLTKELQALIWSFQPVGIHAWCVAPMNIHDEILTPCKEELKIPIKDAVDEFVIKHKKEVSLLELEWKSTLKSWADK